MQYTQVGDLSKPAARLAMGSMVLTTRDEITDAQFMEKTKADSFKLLDEAFDCGYNTIDTAYVYADGESELCLGEWMQQNNVRDKMFIISKGGARTLHFKRNSHPIVIRDILTSCDKLRTDYIDVYLMHQDNPDVPVEEIVDAFAEMQNAGYIHGYGGSNWALARTKRAVEYAKQKGYPEFIVSQPGYSLAVPVNPNWGQNDEYLSLPQLRKNWEYYRDTQMAIFTWSSMARGFWAGQITRDNYESIKDSVDSVCKRAFCYEPNFERLDRVQQLSGRTGASIPNIALAYILNQPLNIHPIIGCNNRADCLSNLEALELKLDEPTLKWLNLESDERPW